MSDTEHHEARPRAPRRAPLAEGRARAFLLVGQTWVWQRSGLVAGLLVALVIAMLTLSPPVPGRMMVGGIDKVYHFLGFAALIFPLILTDSRRWIWAVPLAVAYGGAIELIQPTVGRNAEWLDFGANLTGVLAGAALAEILHDRIRDRFFAVEGSAASDDTDGAQHEAQRLDAMRTELMAELRVVLREELAGLNRAPAAEPAPAEPAPPLADARPDIPRIVARGDGPRRH